MVGDNASPCLLGCMGCAVTTGEPNGSEVTYAEH